MSRITLAATVLGVAMSTMAIAQTASAADVDDALVVTASNTAANQVLVYSAYGKLLKTIPTLGKGGVGGNSGGIAADREHLAVVNFGSNNVSVLTLDGEMRVDRRIPSLASPVSVAFGHQHLYILSTTHVESHPLNGYGVDPVADGSALLLRHDGSAAQVGVIERQLVMSEKSGAIETVKLDARGAVKGHTALVANLPDPANAPFGLVTRGDDAYVTIAHSDEISLVRNDAVLTLTGSGTQHAPCWLALDGPFLFSANSPSQSVSRYVVCGRRIIQEEAVAATFTGAPTDIAVRDGLAAVIDSNGTVSHVSMFTVDDEGALKLKSVVTLNGTATNGVVIIKREE